MPTPLTGLIAATFTPFDQDLELNLGIVPQIVDYLAQNQLTGVYINGSTGEGPSLTIAERMLAAEAYVPAAAARGLTTIVQVGTNSTRQSRELAAHAAEIGADAISSTPPSYFKPSDAETLTDCIAEIASGAPELPYYYYHIPAMTGVTVPMAEFLETAAERIPNLAGIKFCSADMHEMRRCMLIRNGRFEMLSAWDEMLLSGLATGARAAVGSTYNFAAPIYQAMIEAVAHGDLETARQKQDQAILMIDTIFAVCGRAGLKTMMSLFGIDCGPHRPPIRNIDPEQVGQLKSRLKTIGFFAQ
jgi:N-acetylneuraminate lyase